MNPIKQKYLAMPISGRRAFWMGTVYSLLLIVSSVALTPDLSRIQSSLQYVTIFTPQLVGVFSLVGVGLIFNGQLKKGGQLILLVTYLGMLIIPMATHGYGLIAAAVVVVVTIVIATQTMAEKTSQNQIWFSMVVASLILVVDTYWPFYRIGVVSSDATIAIIMTVVLVITFGGLLVSQFGSLPLTTKLVIVILVLTIVPMAVVGYASSNSSRAALVENANQSLVSSAEQVAARLDAFVEFNLDSLRTEAQIGDIIRLLELPPDLRSGSEELESTNNILAAFQQRDPIYITSYAVYDRNGQTVADTAVEELGLFKADRDYFHKPRSTGLPYVSDVRVSPVTKDFSMYFSAPIRSHVGEFVGVLRARYDANVLQQLVLSQGNLGGEDSFAMLVSNENILLVHSNAPQLVFRSIVPLTEKEIASLQLRYVMPPASDVPYFVDLPTLADNIVPEKIGVGFVGEFHQDLENEAGHTEQANAVRMSTRPWTVVISKSQVALLEPVTRQQRGNMLVGILAAVLSGIIGSLTAGYLAQPVVKLTGVARQVAAGNLAARAEVTSRDEIGMLGNAFNQMAAQLNSLITGLEQRVADRTKALATSAEVSRRLSTILEQDQLVKEVVNQLQQAFDYYHVHIYLLDADQSNLVMAGGTGEVGQVMLSQGHKIPRGRGLVGRAAATGVPVLVPDVTRAAGWLPNPLLPSTKSELAVPIILGDQVLGVLDVQQDRVEGLKQEDADLLQSIANQVAVGLQNARAYAETQRRADREATISAIGQRIQRTTSTEEALKVAVREIGRVLGTASSVQLGVRQMSYGEPDSGAVDGQPADRAN